MAPLKETPSFSKAIAKTPTNIIAAQIILMTILMLFCRAANAYGAWGCRGRRPRAPLVTLSFENGMGHDVQDYNMTKNVMMLHCLERWAKFWDLKPEQTFEYCTAPGASESNVECLVVVLGFDDWGQRSFIAYGEGLECTKERRCRWQLRKDNPFLYSNAQNKYVPMAYTNIDKYVSK